MAAVDAPRSEYDIIFAGAGTVACVIAGRLAAADPTLRILMLETGTAANVPPGTWTANVHRMRVPGDPAETFSVHRTQPGKGLDGRAPHTSHARCIGGGSIVNGMLYNRAAASDFDDWMQLGNPGWGSADLIPLAKKLETYQLPNPGPTHGTSGPIKISMGGFASRASADFLAAAEKYPRGRKLTEDVNDFGTADVYGHLPKYIDAHTGRRSDALSGYITSQPASQIQNIHILPHARVVRVLFDETRATGVEYARRSEGGEWANAEVQAKRMVILSAGAYCSPAILERSGIGAKERLAPLGIDVRVELPGVGENLNDHISASGSYLIPQDTVTLDDLAGDNAGVYEKELHETGKGLLASNGIDAVIKLRPSPQDLLGLPEVHESWDKVYKDAPDKGLLCVYPVSATSPKPAADAPKTFTMRFFLLRPLSIGYTHITSADAFAPLDVDPRYLEKDQDLALLRWGYKWSRELARRMGMYRGEYTAGHPAFPAGSEAAPRAGKEGPVAVDAPEIRYTEADDRALDTFIRATASAVWHALGTTAMKPRPLGGVVDSNLNVYGVTNLKVADMSIAPLNVGANTNNTALIIGEKAALIIAEELGVVGV